MLVPSKRRQKGAVAAPVVPCGCCVVGLAPAHTAAVWLSVWAARITGRPFTPALSAAPLPQRLFTPQAPCSIVPFSVFCNSLPSSPVAYTPDCYLPHFISPICLSVFLSLPYPPLPPSISCFPSISFCLSTHTNINSSSWELL